LAAVLAAVLALVATTALPARAHHGELDPALDDPPGCTTATSEDVDGCGAQGRDHFGDVDHRPPVEACADSTAPTGSRITRILPDGPRRADGSLAFLSGACVYLPPGYATSGLRYPVVYVLHGGGGDQADWVTFGDIQGVLDRAHASDPAQAVIAVMPDGRSGQWFDYEDGSFLLETYVLGHLVPWVDDHFRTLADRSGRAVVGLSNGGYGAMHLAGKAPDRFVAAGGMSSNLGARTMSGLGADGAVHHQGSVPYQLAGNYDGVDLILDVAAYCTAPDPLCATIAVDWLFLPDHVAFQQRMAEVGHDGDLDLRFADGAHQFTWWTPWLEDRQLPFLLERLADPQPRPASASSLPESFRYRSIRPAFSVWGYDVAVERDAREFLDLRAVTAGGFEVQGSGRATILTAPRYRPQGTYVVAGTDGSPREQTVRADAAGRLAVEVDLGPSHTEDQFTDAADVAEAQGGYWTVRTVTIREPGSTAPQASEPDEGAAGPGAPAARPAPRASSPRSGPAGGPAPGATAAPETAPGASDPAGARPSSPIAARWDGPEPQLVPTLLFLAALGAGAGVLARRRLAARQDGRAS
jgi:S-formylglutathione hydrolase FrmB